MKLKIFCRCCVFPPGSPNGTPPTPVMLIQITRLLINDAQPSLYNEWQLVHVWHLVHVVILPRAGQNTEYEVRIQEYSYKPT
jgi:hypothetical protein